VTGINPVTPIFPAGYPPTPANMDTWVQTPFTFLSTKVMFRAQLQGTQSLSAGTDSVIHFGSTAGDIQEDPYNGWSTTTTSSQAAYSWLCPTGCTAWYEVTLTAFTANPGSSTDLLQAELFLDGARQQQTSLSWGINGHGTGSSGSVMVALIGGVDYISMAINSTVTVNTTATNGQYPTMEICWVTM
jgi:hypothetical protein